MAPGVINQKVKTKKSQTKNVKVTHFGLVWCCVVSLFSYCEGAHITRTKKTNQKSRDIPIFIHYFNSLLTRFLNVKLKILAIKFQ